MRKAIFWAHLCAGLAAGIVILIMSVTGVLLMYQKQITAWADGVSVRPSSQDAKRLTVEELIAKVGAFETAAPTAIALSSDPSKPATFSYGREKTLFVDPYTGANLGEGSKRTRAFFQLMIEWHRYLGRDGDSRALGKAITGASNLLFFFLVCSGTYLWWPRNWNLRALKAVTLFDRSATGKARDWNWHNVIGIWSSIPLAVLVFTATFFSYPSATDWLYKATGENPPPKPAPPAPRAEGPRASGPEKSQAAKIAAAAVVIPALNDAWAKAEAQLKDWRTISLRMPSSPSGALNFTVDAGNGARPDLRGQLTIDPKSGETKWEGYESQVAARKIRLWVRWLHTGEAGGFIGQTVAGLASAGGAMLVWTGVALAIRRFFKRKTRRVEPVEETVTVS